MSPSPATGLSKGEREREINSTNFGECKNELRTFISVLSYVWCLWLVTTREQEVGPEEA